MNAAANPRGLGAMSTRPLTREERRAEAARIRAEEAARQEQPPAEPPATEQQTSAPPSPVQTGPAVSIPLRRKADKRPFSTQLRAETVARLTWLVGQGAILTDTVDTAITAYLDAAGVPRPGPDGQMPAAPAD